MTEWLSAHILGIKNKTVTFKKIISSLIDLISFTIDSVEEIGLISMFLHGQVDTFWKSLFPNNPKSLHCYIAIACCPSWHNFPVLSPKQAKFSHQHFSISSWFLSGFHICKDASTSLSVCKPALDNLHKHRKNLHDTNIEADLAEGHQCFLSSMEKYTRSMPTSRLLLCLAPFSSSKL